MNTKPSKKNHSPLRVSWFTRLLDFIAPRSCAVCGERLTISEEMICVHCLMKLPRTHLELAPYDNPMVRLFWHILPVEKAAAFYYYHTHSKENQIVYRMKYGGRHDYCEIMGRMMAMEMQRAHFFDDIDALVPVPLSLKRMRSRGYNQCEYLAKGISEVTGIPVVTNIIKRNSFKGSQTKLVRYGRAENVESMFESTPQAVTWKGRHLLLIDDVCTTGATLKACGYALKDIESIRLSFLTLTKTPF